MDESRRSGIIFSENDVIFGFYTFFNRFHAGEIILKTVNKRVIYGFEQSFVYKSH